MDDSHIFGFDVEELKVMFLIVAVIFSLMQFLGGNWITAIIILPLAGYVLYSERKREHWESFLSFVREFREEEERQSEVLQGRDVVEVVSEEDEELLKELTKEMERGK